MNADTRTSVMLVDDHSIMRDLLRDALEETGEYRVVAQAADGQEALRLAGEAVPDVVVMDVIMPVMDGIEACREITGLLPDTKVLMLTASNEQDAIVRSIAAGATGYLQKYSGKEQLLATLREVAEGEFRIPGNAARRLARAVRGPLGDASAERLDSLTDREVEILKLFAGGLSYQEIGDVREISALTVRNAVSGVQKKLGFRTRQQMVVWAIRAGVVDNGGE
ncbi:MAG: response regulator transcription factor [Chloroflexi bacterium]|nr:response regulator transcription factor [Chloroflexota bacterium]